LNDRKYVETNSGLEEITYYNNQLLTDRMQMCTQLNYL
jgi:hypothetical protein